MNAQAAVATVGDTQPAVICASLPMSVLAKGERRFESEAYLTGGYAIRQAIEWSGMPYAPLAQLARIWQPGRLKGIRVTSEHGTPFFTATQLFDIRPTARKWLAPSHTYDLENRYVQPGWILVTCSGSVGEAIMSYSPHVGAIISHDILRVQVENPDLLGYMYAFLKTRYGRSMLQSSQYGSIIKHLEPEHLFEIPIPLTSDRLRESTNEQIASVFQLRDQAYGMVQSAEERFSEEIGSMPKDESDETGYTVFASHLFSRKRRIDAYHYNPKTASVLAALQASGKPLVPLGTVVKEVFLPNRFTRVPASQGIPYLGSEDIFKINPEITKFIARSGRAAETYFVKRGWILIARSGQIYGINGSSMLADSWHEQKVISEDIIRVIPADQSDAVRSGYLQAVLSHPIFGRPLVLRSVFGTSVPHISPEELKDVPIVRLHPTVEGAIADCIEHASTLRMKADQQENTIVDLVEQAIDVMLGHSPLSIVPNPRVVPTQPLLPFQEQA